MNIPVVNQMPYIKTSRDFTEDIEQLAVVLDETYIQIADAINKRTIGIFPTNRPAIGGESWFITKNQRQQNLRQVYVYTIVGALPQSFPHGLNWDAVNRMTKCSGSYTDALGFQYGAIFASSVAIAGQITFYVNATNIVILAGAGALVPTEITIVLEWLADV